MQVRVLSLLLKYLALVYTEVLGYTCPTTMHAGARAQSSSQVPGVGALLPPVAEPPSSRRSHANDGLHGPQRSQRVSLGE